LDAIDANITLIIMKTFTMALCQITPTFDKENNIERAITMIEEAATRGAALVCLPEMFYYPFQIQGLNKIAADESRTVSLLCQTAKRLGIYLCTGSMACKENGVVYNRSYLLDPRGDILLKYDKCHLFDVNFRGLQIRESSVFTPGNQIASVETELGRIAILICYDIRFPELLRKRNLLGIDLLLVPAVFNNITGPAHWHVMMRARAIENQIFLAAVSQGENSKSLYKAYGHSMVVSPWGDILAEADQKEQIVYAECRQELIDEARARLPLLEQRRTSLYNDNGNNFE
jgi:predicted amidohydrolase